MSLRLCLSLALVLAPWSSFAESADEVREVQIEELKLTVPAHWKQQPPSNNLRLGQFQIPPVEGDDQPAELTIFNFGAAGGVQANLDRWVEQFQPAERKSKTTKGKSRLGEYVIADISGTYKKPIGPPILNKTEPMANARMLGVILSVEKKGLYFLKLTGPDKTVAAAAAGLRSAIGGKPEEEQPYDSKQEGAGKNQ